MRSFILSLFFFTPFLFAGYDEGVSLFKAKQYQKAIPHFKEVIELAPNSWQGYYMLALCYAQMGDQAQALKTLEIGHEKVSGNLQLSLFYANLLIKTNQTKKAIQVLKSLPAEVANGNTNYHRLAGFAYFRDKQYNTAMMHFQKVINKKPDFSTLYQGGLAAYNSQAYTTAYQWLEKAIESNPKDLQARYWYIQALVQAARLSRSNQAKNNLYLRAADQSIKLAQMQGDYEYLLLAGETLMGAKKYNDALTYLTKASKLKPAEGFPFLYLGQVLSALEKYEKAIEVLKKSINLLPKNKQKLAWRQLGYCYQKLNRFDEAIAAYEKAGDIKRLAEAKDAKQKYEQNLKAKKEEEEYLRRKKELEKLQDELKKLEGSS